MSDEFLDPAEQLGWRSLRTKRAKGAKKSRLGSPFIKFSRIETSLGAGSDRRDQRHDNEGQQEDYEQHRPEQEPEDQEESEGDLGLAAQSRHQTFDRCPHRILTRQDSPNAFQPRFHARTTVCDRLDERVHPLLDLPRQHFPAVSHRVQKPVNMGF